MSDSDKKLEDLGIRSFSSAPPPTEVLVKSFEQQVGSTLPHEYRKFLIKWGFCAFGKAIRIKSIQPCLWSGGQWDYMTCFYGLGNGGSNDLHNSFRTYMSRVPRDLLAIGADTGGNQVCIGLLDGKVPGAVYFWDREEEYKSANWGNLTLMANDFVELIDRFEEDI